MEYQVNQEVYVETALFSGLATIDYIDQKEMFGIQVVLKEPDEDGHRLKRVSPFDIKEAQTKVESTEEIASSQMVGYSTVNEMNLKVGQPYLLAWVRTSRTHVFYYDIQSGRCLGCDFVSKFENITPLDMWQEPEVMDPHELEIEFVEKKNGQLGFDF